MTEIEVKNEYIKNNIKEDIKSQNIQTKEIDKEIANDKNNFKIDDNLNKNDINNSIKTLSTVNQECNDISEGKNDNKDINIIKDNNIKKNNSEPIALKVVLLGEEGVEKQKIINYFASNYFDEHKDSSLYISKILDFPKFNKSLRFDIWDTVGIKKFRSLAKIYYKEAQVIIFV